MRKKKKVLKKLKKEKAVHICYFCGSTKRITRHHKIFRVFLNGQVLDDNIEYLCKKCHDKFHKLAEPVINLLVKTLVKFQPTTAEPIGFIRTNHIKGGKKNAKIHKKTTD